MRRAFLFFASCLSVGLAAEACKSHDNLAYQPSGSATASSSDGTGGHTSSSSHSSSSTTSGGGGEGGMDAGPPGPSKLTIVNGVNDYDAVRICFVPYPGGGASTPWPSDAAGIAFATAIVVDPIDSAIPPNTDIQPFAIAGDLASIAGKTCDEVAAIAATDAGSPVVTVTLPIIPGAAFTSGKSILLSTVGCMGGPGHDGPNPILGCGMGYSSTTPTASLVIMPMARIADPKRVNLQFAAADAAMPAMDVKLTPGIKGAMDVDVYKGLVNGSISPQFTMLAASDYGDLDTVVIKTFLPKQMIPSSGVLMSEVFSHPNVPKSAFVDGAHLVLVAVGGYPGVPAMGTFWHPHTYALIDSDP